MDKGKTVTIIGENLDLFDTKRYGQTREYHKLQYCFSEYMKAFSTTGYDNIIIPVYNMKDLLISNRIKFMNLYKMYIEYLLPSKEFLENFSQMERLINLKFYPWHDSVTFISEKNEDYNYKKEMQYFLEKSDCLMTISDEEKASRITYTAHYAESRGLKVIRFYTDPGKIAKNSILKNFANVLDRKNQESAESPSDLFQASVSQENLRS